MPCPAQHQHQLPLGVFERPGGFTHVQDLSELGTVIFFSVTVAHTFSLQLGNADNLSYGSANILPVLPMVMQTEPAPSPIS